MNKSVSITKSSIKLTSTFMTFIISYNRKPTNKVEYRHGIIKALVSFLFLFSCLYFLPYTNTFVPRLTDHITITIPKQNLQ